MTIPTTALPATGHPDTTTRPADAASLRHRTARLLANAEEELLSRRNAPGHWEGELSSSALSTATASLALHLVEPDSCGDLVRAGCDWLERHANPDGGWGDTVLSHSNISTTLLCTAALHRIRPTSHALPAARDWIAGYAGGSDPDTVARAVIARYGRDRTFSVPILMTCAIGGILDADADRAWRRVLPLPFELAACPRSWFAALRLPVVSYALPALIAIGYTRFINAPPRSRVIRSIRRRAWDRCSGLLHRIQPASGGYLEATPLTSFVTMALAAAGCARHPVVTGAVGFLRRSMRSDGSWPIDTNLATWVTTLSVKALPSVARIDRTAVRTWLLAQQYRTIHPYTDAPPGGFAWTDLPGGVPDADDTPGALLALRRLADQGSREACIESASAAARWLLGLQNRDGGIPTFCRGWGTLPFDRSSPDLTAHVLRAWNAWNDDWPSPLAEEIRWASRRAIGFLKASRNSDGSWHPLWFGNQHASDETNPTYGTSMVTTALAALEDSLDPDIAAMVISAARWFPGRQNGDGGWGGAEGCSSSIEETALAIEAMAAAAMSRRQLAGELLPAIERGIAFLDARTNGGRTFPPAPIGFYFAKLWYFEALYPVAWTVGALSSVLRLLADGTEPVPPSLRA